MNLSKEAFIRDYKSKIISMFRTTLEEAGDQEKYLALGALIRDYMAPEWLKTEQENSSYSRKHIYYFSMEFLIGRLLDSVLINLGIRETVREALGELGIELEPLETEEPDAGLGNGGLGRLAACFIDSMASLGLCGTGVGIRYKYGLFKQLIRNGYQIETPDDWLKIPNVWEIRRSEEAQIVKFGGDVSMNWNEGGRLQVTLTGYEPVLAVPYDMPVPGFDNNVVNSLRLWSAETENTGFDLQSFSKGDYDRAVENITTANSISNVLYPDDSTPRGKLLRLKQEYFFTSAGLQNILTEFKKCGGDVREFHKYNAIQINDTHPALAVPELMRLLMDDEGLSWDEAWNITVNTFGYTNHTILAEALEKWSVDMFKKLLPRVYMIVEEINRRFISALSARYPGDFGKISRMSIIGNGQVRMAFLAICGSHSVNGVAALHTEILKTQELREFHEFFPGKFNNKTNGITHRRWLMGANPALSRLINESIGENWQKAPQELSKLNKFLDDPAFTAKVREIKLANKVRLSKYISDTCGISVSPDSLFDIQVKRLHMYKRQLLNIFGVLDLYFRLKDDPGLVRAPHTSIFSAKAFPGYLLAKNTVKLICTAADMINSDPQMEGRLKVVFLPNYDVSLAEIMIPAGDVSEQISTASKEASGTGNMKFMMNGAVTLATMDGANVEIHEAVGPDNIVIFGMSADEVISLSASGQYDSCAVLKADPRLSRIMDCIESGFGGRTRADEFKLIADHLIRENDPYYVFKDFDAYVKAQDRIDELYREPERFSRMGLANIAASGRFSSDNTIKKYAEEIWNGFAALD